MSKWVCQSSRQRSLKRCPWQSFSTIVRSKRSPSSRRTASKPSRTPSSFEWRPSPKNRRRRAWERSRRTSSCKVASHWLRTTRQIWICCRWSFRRWIRSSSSWLRWPIWRRPRKMEANDRSETIMQWDVCVMGKGILNLLRCKPWWFACCTSAARWHDSCHRHRWFECWDRQTTRRECYEQYRCEWLRTNLEMRTVSVTIFNL